MANEGSATLYSQGWRQGRLARVPLPLAEVDVDASNTPELVQRTHDLWVVATQDCDLDLLHPDGNEATVELRPVYEHQGADWGVRSRWFRLAGLLCTHADRPRMHVSPRTLQRATQEPLPDDVRLIAFKKWLGLRYDRPAVPDEHLELMRAIVDFPPRAGHRGYAAGVDSSTCWWVTVQVG